MLKKLLTFIVFAVLLSVTAIASVDILPAYPVNNDDLTCYYNGAVCSPANGCTAQWFVNDNLVSVSSTLSETYSNVNNIVRCDAWRATPPIGSMPVGSASVIIWGVSPVINHPPVIGNIPDMIIPEDTSRTIDLNNYASDPDGDTLTWTVSGNTNIEVIITNGIATITPVTGWNGQETLTFTVSDGRGETASDDSIITVTSVDYPIELNDIPNIIMDENTVYTLDLNSYIIDRDGDLQDIIISGNYNINVFVDSNRILTITPDQHWYGQELLTLQVIDYETSAVDQFTVTVNQVNHIPVITSFTPAQQDVDIYEGTNLLFGVAANDPEGIPLTYRWELDNIIVGAGSTYLYNAIDGPANHILEVFVSDGINIINNTWHITEINVNPIADANGPYYCLPSTTINLRGSAIDPGVNDIIIPDSYTWDLFNNGDFGPPTQVISLGCPSTLGTLHMTLKVTDKDGGSGIERFDVIVTDNLPNNQPYFDPHLTNQNAILNQVFTYNIDAYDADPSDVLTYTDNSALFTINPNTGIISFIPSAIGTIPVAVTICDNKAMANSCTTESFNIFVSLTGNNEPTVQITIPTNGASFTQGSSITFTGIGTDIEDGTLSGSSLVWTSSINGLIGAGNSFSTSALSAGTHTITLTGTDSGGAADTDTISIIVSVVSSQCSDGIDNDADGLIDLNDPGCANAQDNDETNPPVIPQCSDGIDNDADGLIDYPNDLGCISAGDTSEGQSPVAVAGNDIITNRNTIVHFNGSASHDTDGTIVNYHWAFGDGASANGVSPQHSYSAVGNYTVTLTVTDNTGLTGTDSLVVNVRSNGGTGSSGLNTGYISSISDRHEFVIKDFKIMGNVNAGQEVKMLVEIENTGSYDETVNLKLSSDKLLLVRNFGDYEVKEGKSKLVYLIFNLDKDASGKYVLKLEVSNDNYETSKTLEIDTTERAGFINVLTGAVAGYNVEVEKESSVWIWLILILIVLVLIGLGTWKIYKDE